MIELIVINQCTSMIFSPFSLCYLERQTYLHVHIIYILLFCDVSSLQLGVTPLPDNEFGDKYLYEVVVHTGMRKNAGTDSKVRLGRRLHS